MEKLTRNVGCPGIKLMIQGHTTLADLLIVLLEVSQVILGTVWLKRLGPTLWDF